MNYTQIVADKPWGFVPTYSAAATIFIMVNRNRKKVDIPFYLTGDLSEREIL